jgi:digeranylgeranylglycerophospholipid reductase
MKKVLIIGAGPIGCFTAKIFAEKGYDVSVFEEHKSIGLPIRCTGLLSGKVPGLNLDDTIIQNKVNKVKLKLNDEEIIIKLKKPELVICREKFDNHIANLAIKKGVKIYTEHKFLKFENNIAFFENNKKIKFDYLIGADGPLSKVKQSINKSKTKFWTAIQGDIVNKYDRETITVYLGNLFKEFFGWEVPVTNKIARVGFASKKRNKEAQEKLNIKNLTGGIIPIYDPNLWVVKNNIGLVGDAATHVKATTGGGLMQGIIISNEIVENLINKKNVKNKDLKAHFRLNMHLLIRDIMDNFNQKDYEYLFNLCKNEKIRKIIGDESREEPKKMLIKLLINEPRFLKYLFKIKLKNLL